MHALSGIISALWTPTDGEGVVDDGLLQNQVAFVLNGGVSGILALGSTGEFPHFDVSVREALLHRVTELAAGRPVLANVSDVNPRNVRRLARAATAAGCAGIALLPPWYFSLSQADLTAFFLDAAGASTLPVYLYNFPERVGNRISLETVAAVAHETRVAGVKQSGAEWSYHQELITLGRELGFSVLTGSDTRLDEAFAMGCTGCISGLSNLCPELLVEVCTAQPAGKSARVAQLMGWLKRIGSACGAVQFPMDVAAGMRARGLDPGAPKQIVSQATHNGMAAVTAALTPLLRESGLIP